MDTGVLFLGETRSRAFVIGVALVIVGAGITLRGARDQRSGATAHPYGPHRSTRGVRKLEIRASRDLLTICAAESSLPVVGEAPLLGRREVLRVRVDLARGATRR